MRTRARTSDDELPPLPERASAARRSSRAAHAAWWAVAIMFVVGAAQRAAASEPLPLTITAAIFNGSHGVVVNEIADFLKERLPALLD